MCRRFTANTIRGFELVKNEKARELNERILNADWLEHIAVTEPHDLVQFEALLAFWAGPEGKNKGEAEVLLLCERQGWIGIVDDWQGRNEAHRRGRATVALP